MATEILGFLWQDIVFAIGGLVGLVSKAYALYDSETTWSRWASIPNAALMLPTVIAFYTLGLYITATMSTISMLIWFGIGIWRPPETEDQ
jgi:hypothetical protein